MKTGIDWTPIATVSVLLLAALAVWFSPYNGSEVEEKAPSRDDCTWEIVTDGKVFSLRLDGYISMMEFKTAEEAAKAAIEKKIICEEDRARVWRSIE